MPTEPSSPSAPPNDALIRQWDGATPIIMSTIVLVMVIVDFLSHGPHPPHHDEGTADHIAMLLMFGQIPIMFWFTAPWRRRGRSVLPTLAIQLSLWAVTFASAVVLS